MLRVVLTAGLAAALLCSAQQNPRPAPAASAKPAPATARLDSAARRNENVQINRIDTEAIKESNVRLGDNVTIVSEAPAETNYYAAEHGRPPVETGFLRPAALLRALHGELFEWHQNSVFNARTFFQVGGVEPSRRNTFGGRFTGAAASLGYFTANLTDRKIRGMVNGNVLVPLESERTPLATDPAVRAVIARWMAAYPAVPPNRLDFDPRALNTNAPQLIDEIDGDLRWDRAAGSKARVSALWAVSRQHIDAFEFVAGQNPDTDIHAHRGRLTYSREVSPQTELALTAAFDRVKSLLVSEPGAVGPRVRFGYQIQELGPDSMFPIDRAQNGYRYAAVARRQSAGGRHALTFGGDVSRYQLNGVESNNQRGLFWFTNNYGHSALENFRLGLPSMYEVTLGKLERGFRNWSADAFLADKWTPAPRFQIYYGLRYNLVSVPLEVNRLSVLPYGCDCNNFSPRFSIAWTFRGRWTLRTFYTVSFGEIMPVTYQQVRNNPPLVHYFAVQNPSLLDPLQGIDQNSPTVRTAPTVYSSDMVSPYVHQYSLSFERKLADGFLLRFGYTGSRSFKLLNDYITNRAQPVPDLSQMTTATVDARRPDSRYYDVKNILNGGIAYLDAAQVSLQMPWRRGLTGRVSYTFSKAIDEGTDYTFTAANNDLLVGRSQWMYDSAKDKKSLSLFDSTHALLVYYYYDLPKPFAGRLARLANGWQVSGVTMMKSGTPLTLYVGSDAPGFGNVDGGSGDRPNIVDPSILGKTISDPNTAPKILRRDRFDYIHLGQTRGNLGRGTFRKSPIANFNAALSRQWRFGNGAERALLFRAEAYNLTNHPQFDEPQRNLSAQPFGKITNTLNDGRVLQFGFRVML